jgi:hypothetical protein
VTDGQPSPDARSLHPGTGLFGVLGEAAEVLLDELAAQYIVERRETKESLGADGDGPLVRTVWLVPRTPAAGPLSILFNHPAGVVLRLGRWYEDPLPARDGDEDPDDDLVVHLRSRALALVEGGLWERVRRGLGGSLRETRLIGPGFTTSRQAAITASEARAARREGFAAAIQWAPWPRRSVG